MNNNILRLRKTELLWLALILVGLYILVPQFSSFRSSLHELTHPSLTWTLIAILFMVLTFVAAAVTYVFLAFKKLKITDEIVVQIASMFINRLLPAGIGGIGVNYEYLRYKKHRASQAALVVATNNLLGLISHFGLIVASIIVTGGNNVLPKVNLNKSLKELLIVAGVTLLLIVLVAVYIFFKEKYRKVVHDIFNEIKSYKNRPFHLLFALISQVALSVANILCLQYSAYAVNVHVSFVQALLVYTIGSGLKNITPTPGGIGGFEAGLVAGLIAYGINSNDALAAVLLYRIISYWGPMIISSVTFLLVQHKGWFKAQEAA